MQSEIFRLQAELENRFAPALIRRERERERCTHEEPFGICEPGLFGGLSICGLCALVYTVRSAQYGRRSFRWHIISLAHSVPNERVL